MTSNFSEFVNLCDLVEFHGAIAVDENFSWAKSIVLPNLELDLPLVTKKSPIQIIIKKKNPIHIQLKDGTKLYFTHDEFRRINPEPLVGKVMTVKMIRLPTDGSPYPSQIKSCEVD
jgi:hypothetical protein